MNIAALRFSALGDIACSLPFLRALKTKPVIVTTPIGRELLKDEFDEFLTLKSKKLADVWALVAQIRKQHFDVFIDLQNNDRSLMIDWLNGARKTYTNKGIPRSIPTFENMMGILTPTGLLGELDTVFEPKPHEYIVLNTGSSAKWASKRLPANKWQEFAALLLKRYKLPFVLTGSPDEADYVASLADKLPGDVRNYAGKTSQQELKTLLKKAFLVISTDSAPMHIAAAMKTPVVGLFGATNWIRSAPYGHWATVLYDRTVYPDGQPPIPNRTKPGAYYDRINLAEGLDQLASSLH